MMKKNWSRLTRPKWRGVLYRRAFRFPDWMKAAMVLTMLVPAVWMIAGMAILAVVAE